MKNTELPSHEECAELMDKGEANFLHIFIYENEPMDESGTWRKQLADAITRIQRNAAREAWDESEISLSRANGGGEFEDEEEKEYESADSVEEYLDREYPIEG